MPLMMCQTDLSESPDALMAIVGRAIAIRAVLPGQAGLLQDQFAASASSPSAPLNLATSGCGQSRKGRKKQQPLQPRLQVGVWRTVEPALIHKGELADKGKDRHVGKTQCIPQQVGVLLQACFQSLQK